MFLRKHCITHFVKVLLRTNVNITKNIHLIEINEHRISFSINDMSVRLSHSAEFKSKIKLKISFEVTSEKKHRVFSYKHIHVCVLI